MSDEPVHGPGPDHEVDVAQRDGTVREPLAHALEVKQDVELVGVGHSAVTTADRSRRRCRR